MHELLHFISSILSSVTEQEERNADFDALFPETADRDRLLEAFIEESNHNKADLQEALQHIDMDIEICDEESVELLRGLSLYRLIDELVIFLIPSAGTSPLSVSDHLPPGNWRLVKSKAFRNGVCRLNYCMKLQ